MADLTQRYQALKKRESDLTLQLAGEESSFNTLRQQYNDSLKELCDRYNVTTLDELKTLLTKEEAELTALVTEAEQKLSIYDPSSSLGGPLL